MAPRDYARLHFDWYRDEVLEAIAEDEPAALWIWPVLIGMAKEESHARTNPTGVFERSASGIGKAAHVPADQVERALQLLVEGEFLTTSPADKPRVLRIELANFAKWQTPRSGGAEREQRRRDTSRENVPSRDADVTGACRSVDGRLETGEVLSGSEQSSSPSSKKASTGPSPEQVRGVFDYWRELFNRSATVKLDEKRRRRIVWALRTYDRDGVAHCLRGYANDREWPRDTPTKNEIATLLRDAAHVEAGIEKYQAQQGMTSAGGVGRTSKDDAASEVW